MELRNLRNLTVEQLDDLRNGLDDRSLSTHIDEQLIGLLQARAHEDALRDGNKAVRILLDALELVQRIAGLVELDDLGLDLFEMALELLELLLEQLELEVLLLRLLFFAAHVSFLARS